jgi:hypothetical protein
MTTSTDSGILYCAVITVLSDGKRMGMKKMQKRRGFPRLFIMP